ncbi:MAG: hypothetical protein MMC23_004662 [Stictis urceolatum]|nr:hypothetical protein [Stictis urceolata]
MPLIVISGFPCSGKTYRAEQLKSYFQGRIDSATDPQHKRLKVIHHSDDTLGILRSVYETAREEKDARATLASAVKRDMRKDVIVIFDTMNYIKGYRYQMYCEAKGIPTPSCVVHVGTPVDQCKAINEQRIAAASTSEQPPSTTSASGISASEGALPSTSGTTKADSTTNPTTEGPASESQPPTSRTSAPASPPPYEPSLLTNLIFRYEEPNGMTRWDSPLFTIPFPDPHPPYTQIWDALIRTPGNKKAIKPNLATVLPTSQPADALQHLDRATNDIVSRILEVLRDNPDADEVRVQGVEEVVRLPAGGGVGIGQLQRLRRQFCALQRSQVGILGGEGRGVRGERVGGVFVGFLNAAWGTEE